MSTQNGWIKIHRKMLDWEWYSDINTKVLFYHLILIANHKEKKYQGLVLKPGTILTSRSILAEQTGLSVSAIRTSLNKLKSTNEIDIKSTAKGTVIELTKYSDYQSTNCEIAKDKPAKKKKPVSTPEPISFTDPIVQSKEQSISQDIDVLSFWNSLLGIYNPEGDKSLHNPSLKKQREKILKHNFTKEERDFILKTFTKYLPQLNIVKPWIGNFFKDHDNMDKVADYFRSIKDVKEPQIKPKYESNFQKKNTRVGSLDEY